MLLLEGSGGNNIVPTTSSIVKCSSNSSRDRYNS